MFCLFKVTFIRQGIHVNVIHRFFCMTAIETPELATAIKLSSKTTIFDCKKLSLA